MFLTMFLGVLLPHGTKTMVVESDRTSPAIHHVSPELTYPDYHEIQQKHSTAETVESLLYILEEVLSHRLHAIRKRLIEQDNDKYYRDERNSIKRWTKNI